MDQGSSLLNLGRGHPCGPRAMRFLLPPTGMGTPWRVGPGHQGHLGDPGAGGCRTGALPACQPKWWVLQAQCPPRGTHHCAAAAPAMGFGTPALRPQVQGWRGFGGQGSGQVASREEGVANTWVGRGTGG